MSLEKKSSIYQYHLSNKIVCMFKCEDFREISYKTLRKSPLFKDFGIVSIEDYAADDKQLLVKVMKCLEIWKSLESKPFSLTGFLTRGGESYTIHDCHIYSSAQLNKVIDFIESEHKEKLYEHELYVPISLFAYLTDAPKITVTKRLSAVADKYSNVIQIKVKKQKYKGRLVNLYRYSDMLKMNEFFKDIKKKKRMS